MKQSQHFLLCLFVSCSAITNVMGQTSGTCGDSLTWVLSPDNTTLTISGSGAMSDFDTFFKNAPWYAQRASITTVQLDEGITYLGDYAFLGCSALTEINIPQSVEALGCAFVSSGLTSITIPERIKKISSKSPFYDCNRLTAVEWNATDCTGGGCFQNNKSITSVRIGENVKIIPEKLFSGCSALTEIVIPDNVNSIGASAFENTAITEVTIPKSISYIAQSAFNNNKELTTVHWNATSAKDLTESSGSLFSYCPALTTVHVGESVRKIPNCFLYRNSSVTEVIIDEGLDSIGISAFRQTMVKHFDLPESLSYIGAYAFTNTQLEEVTIGKNVHYLGDKAFAECMQLKTVQWNATDYRHRTGNLPDCVTTFRIGEGVHKLPDYLYSGGAALEEIYIPASMDTIGYAALRTNRNRLRKLTVLADELVCQSSLYNSLSRYIPNTVDTLIIGEGVRTLDLVQIGVQSVCHLEIPNAQQLTKLTTWQLPTTIDEKHPHDRYTIVYDTDGDGFMELLTKDKISDWGGALRDGLICNLYGLPTDTIPVKEPRHINLLEFVNLHNNGRANVMYHADWWDESSYNRYSTLAIYEKEGNKYQEIWSRDLLPTDAYYDVLDLNGDGLSDIVEEDHAYLQQRDGSFLRIEYKIIRPDEVDSLIYQTKESSGNSLLGMPSSVALSFNNIVRAYTPSAASLMPARIAIDIDCNGLPDIVDLKTANVLFNYGNGHFMRGSLGTKILALKDLNGDGVTDLLVYDENTQETILLMYVNGEMTRKILEKDIIPSNAWCYDFDRDGDADILLTFDFQDKMGWSFLIFYRNDGNNSFKKKETGFNEALYFRECVDTDNDGLYEILTESLNSDGEGNIYLFNCTAKLTVERQAEPLAPYESTAINSGAYLADFDGDGLTEYSYYNGKTTDGTMTYTYQLRRIAATPNTPPARMSAPNVLYDGASAKLNVSWAPGSDNESSSVDLTYALRIGSAPGQGDMFYAHATADGRRLNIEDGNMGYSLATWVDVDNWPTGDYYLSVQAVDPGHMGGAWSEETVYRHTALSANFSIDRPNLPSSDTLTIAYKGMIMDGYTYDWSFGDSAVVVSQEGVRTRVVYQSSGTKTITLRVTDSTGNSSPLAEQTVTVVPGRFVSNTSLIPDLLADWDMDGNIDGVMGLHYNNSNITQGFYTNDGQGTFNVLGKSFNMNNNISLSNAVVTDYNMDGLPDLIASSNKGNIYLNEEDFDFSIEEEETDVFDVKNKSAVYLFIPDMDNDGFPDLMENPVYTYDTNLYRNIGRLQRSESQTKLYAKNATFADFNRDGYMDILSEYKIDNHPILYLNQGNWMFQTINLNYEGNIKQVADVDNDGYLDLLDVKNEHTLIIAYGDADYSYTDQREVYLPEGYGVEYGGTATQVPPPFDVNNDGYLDMVFPKCMVCFRPDRKYEVFTNENIDAFPNGYSKTQPVTDLNGDGTPDSTESNAFYLSGIDNTVPQAPTNLRVLQGSEGVVLEWDDAFDRETPKMRMRYNVSLKQKGMTGEGAYLISPLNGEREKAAIVPTHAYLTSTRMSIPLHRFEVGQEYELRVQSIDAWNAVSPMSEPFSFTFEDQTALTLSAEKICAGDLLEVRYDATATGTPQWDTDGGELYDAEGNTAHIVWETGGTKQISVTVNGKTATRTIYVIAADTTNLSFSLPDMVLGECQVPFTLPEVCRDPSNKVRITTSSPDVIVERRGTSLDARVTFPAKEGIYTVSLEYESGTSCGHRSFSQSVMVNGSNVTPVISIVSVDGISGKTTVQWDVPDNVLTDPIFDKVILYKEEGSTDHFVKLAELPLSENSFTDPTSNPSVRKSRYRITLGTTYGGESNPSKVHSNVHVMLNKGLGNAVNIIWTKYEGALIDQYSIWRGTSPDNMTMLTTASGNETSYTDFTAPEGENLYYALSYSNVYETEWIKYPRTYATKNRRTATVAEGFSNRTATDEGFVAVLPITLTIQSIENEAVLTPKQTTVHLLADLLPVTATIKQVCWTVTEGTHLAQINDNGTLEYIGAGSVGTVTVQAETIDGSNLSATTSVPVQGFDDLPTELPSIDNSVMDVIVYPNPTHDYLSIVSKSTDSEALLFNSNGKLILRHRFNSLLELSIGHLPNGVYILIVQTENGEFMHRKKIVKI